MKLFQNLVNQVKHIIYTEFGITDEMGLILASSDEQKVGKVFELAGKAAESVHRQVLLDGYCFQKVSINNKLEFITYIKSENEADIRNLCLITINVTNLKMYHEEKFDRASLIKNIIIGNVLPADIFLRAKELHIPHRVKRVAFLIKTEKGKGIYSHEVLKNLFPDRAKDYVITLDEESTILIKELKKNDDYEDVNKIANMILDTLGAESMVKVHISTGTIVDNLMDLGRSFKEAQTAFLVGSIFNSDKYIINYNKLGLGRLIYQLPTTLCKLFLEEVFKNGSIESLDAETMTTVVKFFENNLNISETSRKLYVHRNTLVYRLDKIQKITGLDLRRFDDAIIFKVSMLVKRYLDKTEKVK
jgi:carbohydrate diacid regulator